MLGRLKALLSFLSASSFRIFLYEIAAPVRLPATNVVFIIHLSRLQNKRASRHILDDCMNAHPHAALLLLHFSSITNHFKEHSRTQPDSKPFFLLYNAPLFLSFYQEAEIFRCYSQKCTIPNSSSATSRLSKRMMLSSTSSRERRFMLPYQTIFSSITAKCWQVSSAY